jgi:hypothetical protein
VPTYDATQAFRRAFAKLDVRTAAAFMAAVAVFVSELAERGSHRRFTRVCGSTS